MADKYLKFQTLTKRAPMDDVHPAPRERAWMDQTAGAFAYRCVPLAVANSHGWEIRCPVAFTAVWNGGAAPEDIAIDLGGNTGLEVSAHFGNGILTFEINAIIRTPPGYNLWVSGPPNHFKDGIQPLSAVVETDWMPFTFTMNWKFTRPHHEVTFSKDEPVCFFFPIRQAEIEEFDPTLSVLSEDSPDWGQYNVAHMKRNALEAIKARHGVVVEDLRFQKWYMKGEVPDGSSRIESHRNALDVKPFRRITDG